MTDDQLVQLGRLEQATDADFVEAIVSSTVVRLNKTAELEQRVVALEKVVADLLTRRACRCSK